MRIGDYLIHAGLITEDDLKKALNTQVKAREPMGILARQKGTLMGEGLVRVLRGLNKAGPGGDFGRIALDLGLLNEKQVAQLRDAQRGSRKLLGSVLLNQGALNRAQLINALKGFQALKKE